jgi:hypothetical protein
MEQGLKKNQTDIQNMEEDVKKNCSAICDLISHTIECVSEFIFYFCRPKS